MNLQTVRTKHRGKKTHKPKQFLLCGSNTDDTNPDRKYLLLCTPTSFDTSSSTLLLRAYSDSQLDLHRHLLSDQVYICSKQQRQTISPATTFINNELGCSKKRLRKMTAEFLKDVKERRGNEREIHNGQNNFCKERFLAFKKTLQIMKLKMLHYT